MVCNTVRRAQWVYLGLKQAFPGLADDGDAELDLLHSRFLYEDREGREQRCLRRFGKSGIRPWRAVLVATRIIEQSLDVDFDFMVTDLAPVDLVLQRIGRLHRHDRVRPVRLREPAVAVGMPPLDDGGTPPFPEGWVRVPASNSRRRADGDRLKQLVSDGIGPGKAYGFGLLSLAAG